MIRDLHFIASLAAVALFIMAVMVLASLGVHP